MRQESVPYSLINSCNKLMHYPFMIFLINVANLHYQIYRLNSIYVVAFNTSKTELAMLGKVPPKQ